MVMLAACGQYVGSMIRSAMLYNAEHFFFPFSSKLFIEMHKINLTLFFLQNSFFEL